MEGRKYRQTRVPLRKGGEIKPSEVIELEIVTPPELEGEAKAEFERLIPLLKEMLDLKQIDAGLLGIYCQEIAKYWACERVLAEKGYTMTTSTGYEQQRPEVSISKNALMNAKAIAHEFGFSVLSRKKLFSDKINPKTRRFSEKFSGKFADKWASI